MGEMERTASGRDIGLLWDLCDIFTRRNFLVEVVAGLIGYALVERLRDGLRYARRKQLPFSRGHNLRNSVKPYHLRFELWP
jgi:hypothetical protein